MYKPPKFYKSSIKVKNATRRGETIEEKIRRIILNKEPIKDGSPLVYQERGDGVAAAYDIRTDRFDLALEARDKATKTHIAKRTEAGKVVQMGKDQGQNQGVNPDTAGAIDTTE